MLARRPLLLVAAMLVPAGTAGQERPRADPADVASLDAVVAALYDVISGPAGAARDWDRMRSLFIPGARLIPSGPDAQGRFGHSVWTVDEYIQRAGPRLEERGFYEREIGRKTDRWGSLVQMFSAYDSRRTPEDPEPFARGINAIQAMHDGERWWIVTVYWTAERPDNPIPQEYLGRR